MPCRLLRIVLRGSLQIQRENALQYLLILKLGGPVVGGVDGGVEVGVEVCEPGGSFVIEIG